MYSAYALFDGFEAAIMLVLLFFCYSSTKELKGRHGFFSGLVWSHMLLLLCGAFQSILFQKSITGNIGIFIFDIMLVLMAMEYLFYNGYVLHTISEINVVSKRTYLNILPFVIAFVVIGMLVSTTGNLGSLLFGHEKTLDLMMWAFVATLVLLDIIEMVIILIRGNSIPKKDLLVWLSFVLVPLFSVPFISLYGLSGIFSMMTISILLIFAMITINQENEILEREVEIKESKLNIMISQIQPHFLYDVLSAIAQLCEENPLKAKEMTIMFGDYLRKNMDDIVNPNLVPFEKEFKHLKTYLKIEKARFEDMLNIVYDIEVMDFMLPTLTLQPIVENAIKYGIRGKEEGGTVFISTKETENTYDVIVRDDGVGFDEKASSEDSRSHVGIKNVSERLKLIGHASMDITSTVGIGTTVIIHVEKGVRDEGSSY